MNSHNGRLRNIFMIAWELQKLRERTLFDNYRGRHTLSKVTLMRDVNKNPCKGHWWMKEYKRRLPPWGIRQLISPNKIGRLWLHLASFRETSLNSVSKNTMRHEPCKWYPCTLNGWSVGLNLSTHIYWVIPMVVRVYVGYLETPILLFLPLSSSWILMGCLWVLWSSGIK